MRTSRLVALATMLAASSGALAQPSWTLVGPVGFVERFDTPDTAAPDEVFGPPGYTLRDPIITLFGRDGVASIVGTPHTGNNVLRIRTPAQDASVPEAQLSDEGSGDVLTSLVTPSTDRGGPFPETFEFRYHMPILRAAPGDPARVSSAFFLTNPGEFYRFSSRDPTISDLGGSAYFGNTGEMNPLIPGEPTAMRYLGGGGFAPMRVCVDAYGEPIAGCEVPAGHTFGQFLPTPSNAWFTLVIEDLADFRQRVFVDFNDGAGEILVGEMQTVPITYGAGQITVSATLRQPDATLYVDNIGARGYVTTRYPDANGDRIIDFIDLNLALSNFGTTTNVGYPLGDIDNDQAVDFTDLNAILGAFSQDLNN